MARYYDLGFENGVADFERDIYENPEAMVFDSAMSADDCKDYQAGYFDGWCDAEAEFMDSAEEMQEKAYQEGYEQGEDDYPSYNPSKWEKIKYFEDYRLMGYKEGFTQKHERLTEF